MGLDGINFNKDLPDLPTLFDYFDKPASIYNLLTKDCPYSGDLTRKSKPRDYMYTFLTKDFSGIDKKAASYMLKAVEGDHDCIVCLFPGIDEYAHCSDIKSINVIKEYQKVDSYIGDLFQLLIRKGIYEETLVLLSSDHGLTNTHTHIDVCRHLDRNNFSCLHYPVLWKRNPKCASMVSGNGMINFYLKKNKDSWGGRVNFNDLVSSGVVDIVLELEGIDFVAGINEDNSITVKNRLGTSNIGSNTGFSYYYNDKDPLGIEKHLSNLTEDQALKATYDTGYPDVLVLLTQIFRAERTGDLIISASPGFDLRARYEFHEHHATHGALNAQQLFVPFAMNCSINKDYIRTVDAFPLILKLMNKRLSHAVDGSY
jgi:hypothetical protein